MHGIEPNLGDREPLIEELGIKAATQSLDKDEIFLDDREERGEIGKYWAIKSSYRET